jgi:hypothetical protein
MSGGSGRDTGGTLTAVPTALGIGRARPRQPVQVWGMRDER